MASAYATLAADGVHHHPYFIDRVVGRDGKTILTTDPSRGAERVLSTQTARVATQVLLEPIRRGTATKARVKGHVVAGKTGTAQDHQDAWLVGYTPQLATAVWMGAPVGEVPMTNVGGIRVTGGSYPASIWSRFMTVALADLPAVAFPQPNPKLLPKATYLRLKGERVSRSTTTKSRAKSRTGTTAGAGRRATTTSRP
jgi:penicillin-binding protein 1A